ncbi:MAG: hypothetical protein LBH16_03360 [Treponema sp.]|jgi:hypothetical protein|nr:hypothetical protein [Treponema sp.]
MLHINRKLGALSPNGRELALNAGANTVMPNFSPFGVQEPDMSPGDAKQETVIEDHRRVIELIE